ncbi:MAG: SRPBCC family protein [Gammaproteobacteria bacterium]|jgi:hypothetical protein
MFFSLALSVGYTVSAIANQLESYSITENNGEYVARVAIVLDAPAESVYGVLTDYRHIYRINPSIIESEILPARDDQTTRVRSRFEHCFAFFCIELEMVEDVVEVGEGQIVATTVPALSSFTSGNTMWHVRPFEDGKTRVLYRTSMTPKFFIPPLIGSLIIKSRLRSEIFSSFTRVECQARIMASNNTGDIPLRMATRSPPERGCEG